MPGPRESESRRFKLIRDVDISGISGVGHVADGVVFPDGTTVVRWRGNTASTVVWESPQDVIAIHGHSGSTILTWVD